MLMAPESQFYLLLDAHSSPLMFQKASSKVLLQGVPFAHTA